MIVQCLDVNKIKDKVSPDHCQLTYTTDQKRPLQVEYQKTGYGKRPFLICPLCGRRFKRLYLCGNVLMCRDCGNVPVYKGIQNNTKGGYDEIGYRMQRYADAHDIRFSFPFDYLAFVLDERCSLKSFRLSLKILQGLENMRSQSIFEQKQYSNQTIKAVLTGKHPLIVNERVTLQSLRNWFYEWERGTSK